MNISAYPNYVNNNYSSSSASTGYFTPNPDLVAGTTEGTSNVSATGSFNYNIAIKCSPGTAGLQPDLSINYNSNGDNSWLGVGFNLSGISSINRTNKMAFFDNLNGGINFDANDIFAIDGERLFIAGGTYGQNNATYKLEVDNYNHIESFGTQGSGPQYFIVSTRDGKIIEYGKTADSRNTAKSSNEILNWCINKISDEFGNYMTYTYKNNDGEILIDKIEYTRNSNLTSIPYNKILFNYVDRSDNNSMYVAGKEFTRKKILKEIICNDINDHTVRKYVLDYEYSFASHLNKITEVDGLGNTLNPTYFEWSKGNALGTRFAEFATSRTNIIKTIAADMNGDGYQDVVRLINASAPAVEIVFNNHGSLINQTTPLYLNRTIENFGIDIISTFVFDENDDNIDEVYFIYTDHPNDNNLHVYYKIAKLEFNGSTYNVTPVLDGPVKIPNSPTNHWIGAGIFNPNVNLPGNTSGYFFGKEDVSGDNLRDVILADQFNLRVEPSNGQPPVTMAISDVIKTKLGDFNGDGIMDIYMLKRNGTLNTFVVEVFGYDNASNTLNFMAAALVDIGSNPYFSSWSPSISSALLASMANVAKSVDFGDIDGDGKTDIFVVNYNAATTCDISCMQSNGSVFLPAQGALTVPIMINGFESTFFAADVNGDGKCDMIATTYELPVKLARYVYYPSNGSTLVYNGDIRGYYDKEMGLMGDFNADGIIDYVSQQAYPVNTLTYNMFNQEGKKMVKRIYNIKHSFQIFYHMLTPNNAYLTGSSYMPASFKLYRPGMFVVTGTEKDADTGTGYYYEDGLLHREGRGFLGFGKTYTYNRTLCGSEGCLGSVTSSTFNTSDYVVSSETINALIDINMGTGIPVVTIAKAIGLTKTDYNYVTSGATRYLQSSETIQKDFQSSVNAKSTVSYDHTNGGAVLSAVKSYYAWHAGGAIRSESMDYTYITSPHPYNSRPITRIQAATASSAASGISASYLTDYEYDPAGHLIKTVKNSNLPAMAVTTELSNFNNFGAARNIKISAPDLSVPRENVFEYDETGRFITKTTNMLGNSEEYTYEPGLGNKIKVKDISGLTTTFAYDGLGRIIWSKSPAGAVNTVSYDWYSYPIQGNAGIYAVKITGNVEGSGTSVTYLDNRDNTVKKEEPGFNGNTEITEYTYDPVSRMTGQSNMHYQNQSSYISFRYEYDSYNRQNKIVESRNGTQLKTTQYFYNDLSTESVYKKGFVEVKTPNSAGNGFAHVKKENNTAGQVDKVINYSTSGPVQTANYVFNEYNQPASITTAFPLGTGNAVTTILYDELGRQKQLDDPSAGTTKYKYNSIGELLEQTNPNGTYTYLYDELGRLTRKAGTDLGVTTYQYVTAANGRQQLASITGPEVTTEYKYDGLGQVVESKETLTNSQNKIFKSNFTYDKYGRMLNYTYPNGFVTTNEYDGTGQLVKIKNNNSILWQLNTMLTPALPQKYTYANGLSTTLAYDNNFNLAEISAGSISRQTYVINNDNGDIMKRAYDNYVATTANNESFKYDASDRLTKVTSETPSNITLVKANYSYQDNGNLLHKDDCGDYEYNDPARPYNVTSIIDAMGNISLSTMHVDYNDLKKVSKITDAGAGKEFVFTYGNNEQRVKMTYAFSGQQEYTRYYQANYDREEHANGSYKDWCYVFAPTGLCAVNYNENGASRTLFVNTDHLGSPVLLTDHNQTITEENSFDAWGRRRNPAEWNDYTAPAIGSILIRGFQMHEMLDEAGLINMNGRVYDPVLGRFIQPDVIIQEPHNLQSFNRYAYCFNNPLKYIDPSGYKSRFVPRANTGSDNAHNPSHDIVIYVDGVRYESGRGGFSFWLNGGGYGGGASRHNFGFTGTPLSHTSFITADILLNVMHSNNENSNFNSEGYNSHIEMEELPPGTEGIILKEVTIYTDGKGNYSDPSYDIWGEIGNLLSMADFAFGTYNMMYNHNTYITTKGIEKSIYMSNGAVRSAQAAKYAGYSKFVGRLANRASFLSTAYSGYKVATGQGNVMDKMDLGVGIFGLGAGTAAGFGIISNPVGWGIGIGVSIYGGARLLGDVIGDYNPGGPGVGQFYDYSTGTYMIK